MTLSPPQTTLEDLLGFVKATRGFDFTGYKRSSLERRISKRMGDVGVERYDDYVDYLELHPEEFAELFNTILINVTGFYRDAQTWEYLSQEVIPGLIERRPTDAPLRAGPRRRAGARQVRDAAEPLEPVRACRPQAADLPQGRQADAARSRPGDGPRHELATAVRRGGAAQQRVRPVVGGADRRGPR